MAVLDIVKSDLRIMHEDLDDALTTQIYTARAEMKRVGIKESIADDESNLLVTAAIVSYCRMLNANNTAEADMNERSWKYQLDCLRKSSFKDPGGGDV
ncbi:MAG: hypothetical protein J5811_02510 [Lachnospiraceae bacterium]|nr:hypothetical protein [Lachnospiraceae bacterium]